MTTKTYTKKLIHENEFSTPEARAERLKRLRNLANLSRADICDSAEININTYKGWELARFGGIPVDGAAKVVRRIAQSGVICSTEWLLYGKKPLPRLESDAISCFGEIEIEQTEIELIHNEFVLYQNNSKYAVLIEIVDDGLLPNYKIGDFIAGSKKLGDEIISTINKICIVETIDGKICARYVKKGQTDGLYNLICTNYHTEMNNIEEHNVKLLYSAPIERHYIMK